jgi:hypothetical protein
MAHHAQRTSQAEPHAPIRWLHMHQAKSGCARSFCLRNSRRSFTKPTASHGRSRA